MDSNEDQRIFDRFAARFPAKFEDSRHDFGSEVFLRDMSAQGARLVSRHRLQIHDDVSLQIQLPDGRTPVNLNGQVMWIKNQTPHSWETGLKFHRIKFMAMQRLFKFCGVNF